MELVLLSLANEQFFIKTGVSFMLFALTDDFGLSSETRNSALEQDERVSDQDPNQWEAPTWHSDFGDPTYELESLRKFCIELKKKHAQYEVQLDCFEEGFMKVDISLGKFGKIAEIHVVSSDDFIYGLFIGDGDKEIHFNKIEDGMRYFDDCSFID